MLVIKMLVAMKLEKFVMQRPVLIMMRPLVILKKLILVSKRLVLMSKRLVLMLKRLLHIPKRPLLVVIVMPLIWLIVVPNVLLSGSTLKSSVVCRCVIKLQCQIYLVMFIKVLKLLQS